MPAELELLDKQKRMNKTQPVPCIVRTDGLAEEDSLAENVQRVALHSRQFRAFQSLREKEEIAARFPVLHALCLGAFYRMSSDTCLDISAKSASFNSQAPGLADSASAKAIEAHHQQWAKQLPKHEEDLWDALVAFDGDSQAALFAHCASLSVDVPSMIAHADTLARP